jgi:hypothetical protein
VAKQHAIKVSDDKTLHVDEASYSDLVQQLYVTFRGSRGQERAPDDYARAREAADGYFAAKDQWEADHK